jgi:signal transduction histidine kinase
VTGLSSTAPGPELLAQVAASSLDLLSAHTAGVAVRDGDQMHLLAVVGKRAQLQGRSFPFAGSVVEAALAARRRSMDVEADNYPHLNDELFDGRPERVAVALTGPAEAGALYVIRSTALSPDEVEVMELLAASAGSALRDAKVHASTIAERREKEAVIEAMADGLAVLSPDGTVRTWNRALVTLTGLAAGHAVGQPLPFATPAFGEVLEQQLPNGRWIEVLVAPVAGTSDVVVDVRDVTRPKALEAAKDLFLATSSHELRTPLTVLRGFAETLLNYWDVLSDERRQEIVATMLIRTKGMTQLVEQLLMGSHAGLDREVERKPFDLAGTVRDSVGSMAGAIPSHPLVVVAPDPVMAYGDQRSIDAVLGQLVENAVKYSPDGGPITVVVRRNEAAAVLQVADTGVGIAEEDLARVFERFSRGGGSASAGGVGLGLWIVRRYLEAQGGRVVASRREGGGTVIEASLPLAESGHASRALRATTSGD